MKGNQWTTSVLLFLGIRRCCSVPVYSPSAFIDTFNYWHIVIIPIMSEYMHESDIYSVLKAISGWLKWESDKCWRNEEEILEEYKHKELKTTHRTADTTKLSVIWREQAIMSQSVHHLHIFNIHITATNNPNLFDRNVYINLWRLWMCHLRHEWWMHIK